MRLVLTAIAWLGTALVLAPLCFFSVLVLAGPHSSILPSRIQPAVLLIGWLIFLVVPVLAARAAWRRAR
jgi:hypothetical protein